MSDTTRTMSKLITLELNFDNGDHELWFNFILEGDLTKAKKEKLFVFVKSKFDAQKLTYIKTGNLYVYNKVKFDDLCNFLNSLKGEKTEYYYDAISNFKDKDITKEDEGKPLFPMDYRVTAVDLSYITKF